MDTINSVLNQLSSVGTTALGLTKLIAALIFIGSLLYWIYRGWLVRGGIYASIWTDHDRQRTTIELLRVRSFVTKVYISPAIRLANVGRYRVNCKHQAIGSQLITGFWTRPGYEGPVLFKYHQNNAAIIGRWLGPDREGNVRSGDWVMKRVGANSISQWYFSNTLITIVEFIGNAREIISSNPAISANASHFQETINEGERIEVDGVTIRKVRGVFHPSQSSVTRRLAATVAGRVTEATNALDLGTGSGFHAILLAKTYGCRVVAVDSDDACIKSAQANAHENGVAHLIDFYKCEEDDLLSWTQLAHKFDIIVANLPFSSLKNTWRIRKSPYFSAFRGTRRLLVQTVLALPILLKPNGRAFLAHGDSGYTDLLQDLLKVFPWTVSTVEEFQGKFDTMRIFEISMTDFTRSIVAELRNSVATQTVHKFEEH